MEIMTDFSGLKKRMYGQQDNCKDIIQECKNAKGVLLKPVCHWSIPVARKAEEGAQAVNNTIE
jgi:hypothetical protein